MQEIEDKEKQQPSLAPADPESQPLNPVSLTQEEDDPEQIFIRAVAEIDTQPLKVKHEPFSIGEVLEICFLVFVLCFSFMGIVWQCITYPHTLVFLYTKAIPASITTTLDLQTRTLPSVTITRSATITTTGTGHQDARAATGTLIFYNGQLQSVTVPRGSVFTGRDGEQVVTTQDVAIPAADPSTTPPTYGQATVYAQAVHKGASGNIQAFDINGSCCATSAIVKDLTSFHNGQDAKDYKAVAAQDLTALTETVNNTVTRAFTSAFPLQQGEVALPTQCHTVTTANHQIGDEAQSVTLTASKTCSAVAYNSQQLTRQATAAFTQTKPGAKYHIIGSVLTTVRSVSPFSVTIKGSWSFTFSQDYEQLLAQQIAGDTPAQARKVLLRTGVISSASVPSTLPPEATYINFLVLVG